MAYTSTLALLLLASSALGKPFGLGFFDDDDDEETDSDETTENTSSTPVKSSACNLVDSVLAYIGEVYELIDKTFNPFYKPPPAPTPPPTTPEPSTTENVTPAAPVQG